jgi:ankyrin repeat protein
MWEWAKEHLTKEDLIKNLFLDEDDDNDTAWHVAASNGDIKLLEQLWEWGKETLNAGD